MSGGSDYFPPSCVYHCHRLPQPITSQEPTALQYPENNFMVRPHKTQHNPKHTSREPHDQVEAPTEVHTQLSSISLHKDQSMGSVFSSDDRFSDETPTDASIARRRSMRHVATLAPIPEALDESSSQPDLETMNSQSGAGLSAKPQLAPKHSARQQKSCLLYTSPSPRDGLLSRMPSSA